MSTMNINILTPDREVYSGEVTSVTVQGSLGMFQVKYNHAPIISTLDKGKIKLVSDGQEQVFEADGGVIEVLKNKIIILVERVLVEEAA